MAHWQPPNGSHPHKLQQYKCIFFIKSNTKYRPKKIGNLQMAHIHTNFNNTKVFILLSQTQNIYFKKDWQPPNGSHPHKLQHYKSILFKQTQNIDLKILATSKWLPSRQTPTLPKFSLSSHRQNIYLKKYWQSPNASHPHKFQQYKSIIYIKSKH